MINSFEDKAGAANIVKTMIVVIMVVSSIAIMSLFVTESTVKASGENWWSTSWAYRFLCTIDHTKLPVSCSGLPVLVHIDGNVSLHDNAQASGLDVAFVSYSDNSTKFSHEIESWSDSGSAVTADMWVNVSRVSSVVDTKFWMYYGNGGASDQQDKEGTWDDNYVLVAHMNGSSNLYDSTNIHEVGVANSTESSGGIIGNCQTFTKQRVNFSNDAELNITGVDGIGDFTIEIWSNQTSTAGIKLVSKDMAGTGTNRGYYFGAFAASDTGRIFLAQDKDGTPGLDTSNLTTAGIMDNGVWIYNAFVMDWNGDNGKDCFAYMNGSLFTSFATALTKVHGAQETGTWIGAHESGVEWVEGRIDEVRLSTCARNASWIEATYNMIKNPGTFMSFGTYETQTTPSSSLSMKGYDAFLRLNFYGDNGTVVWTNETVYGILNATWYVNASDNVTEINFEMDDLSVTLKAGNVSICVSSDNMTWGTNAKAYVNGKSNITLSKENWNEGNGCYGANPFDGAGMTDVNQSIYVKYKINIPEDAVNGLHTIDTVNIYWKRVH